MYSVLEAGCSKEIGLIRPFIIFFVGVGGLSAGFIVI